MAQKYSVEKFVICYCKVRYILSLQVHEKAKNENCVIKTFERMTLDHLFSDRY